MSIKVDIILTSDDEGAFGARERAVLAAVAGESVGTPAVAPVKVAEAVTTAEEPDEAPAKPKRTRAPRKASASRAAVLEGTPDFEPEAPAAADPEEAEEAPAPSAPVETPAPAGLTLPDIAAKLIGAGRRQEVKDALAAQGASNISGLDTPEKVDAVIAALTPLLPSDDDEDVMA